MIFQRLDDLNEIKNEYTKQKHEVNNIIEELKKTALHPRYDSIIPLSEYVYTNATLVNTEFLIKQGSYKCLAAHQQTVDYLEQTSTGMYMNHILI